MDQSARIKFDNNSLKYGLAYFLNQISFFGLRSTLILYMISKSVNIEQEKAFTIYGFSVTALIFSKITGAIIGDLITGSKKGAVIGAVIQTTGIFILCIPNITTMYIGLGLTLIGSGLFSPNLMAAYGKNATYNSKTLNALILFFYLIASIGATAGVLFIGTLSDHFNFQIILAICGIITLLSSLIVHYTSDQITARNHSIPNVLSKRILYLIIGGLFILLFSIIYKLAALQTGHITFVTYQTFNTTSYTNLALISPISAIPVIIIFIILWSLSYRTTLFRLMSTFALTALVVISFLFIAPNAILNGNFTISITLIGIFNALEMIILALSASLLIENINHKYLATSIAVFSISVSYISTYMLSLSEKIHEYPTHILIISCISLFGLSLLTGIFLWWSKKFN